MLRIVTGNSKLKIFLHQDNEGFPLFNISLKLKLIYQEIENEKLKLERVQILEENSGLHVQNQKLAEEASYAKELASAAAVELKNLAGEVTKLSLQNSKLEKEMQAARELSSRSSSSHGGNRKLNDAQRNNRRGRVSGRSNEVSGIGNDDFDMWNLDPEDIKMELQARKQREAVLEAALAEKEIMEDEYRKKVEEAKRREAALENDLANMWVLVARLKKEATVVQETKVSNTQNEDTEQLNDLKIDGSRKDSLIQNRQAQENSIATSVVVKEEPLVVRLKVKLLLPRSFKHQLLIYP